MQIKISENEFWWGGVVARGENMPFCKDSDTAFNLDTAPNGCDQFAPLFLSSKGRYVWSEKPFAVTFKDGVLTVDSDYEVQLSDGHKTLKGAYLHAMKNHFPFSGKTPDKLFFTAPQYNTWIELGTNQTTEGILNYAKGILDGGLTPGVLMIDGGWQEDYGIYDFHRKKIPDPKYLIDELHKMGFKVMLWTSPIIASAGLRFKELRKDGLLIKNGSDGKTAVREWWSGYSAVLDLTNPAAIEWMHKEMRNLMDLYGVDGYKFDAGDCYFYRDDDIIFKPMLAREHTAAFNEVGAQYPFNEFRAAWKFGGREIVARLHDKFHSWEKKGLDCLVPETILQGLLGYAYCCPDMVGGGQLNIFANTGFGDLDEELFIRWVQANALMGMMQLSIGPWRILSRESYEIVKKYLILHKDFGEHFWELAQNASKTGEPIVRSMEYEFPGCGYERINDQFMLGSDIMVAPVVKKGQFEREVYLPAGRWLSDDGRELDGGHVITENVPIERLCYYKKIK